MVRVQAARSARDHRLDANHVARERGAWPGRLRTPRGNENRRSNRNETGNPEMNRGDERDLRIAAIEAAQRLDPDSLDELGRSAADGGDLESAIGFFLAAMAAGAAWSGFNLGQV
ncbi:MAG: hypothetical protein ACRDLN_17400, partial [Solirubrobacteraceae bacterium]